VRENGCGVSECGRISQDVQDAYSATHPDELDRGL